jgi:hypothetical protein
MTTRATFETFVETLSRLAHAETKTELLKIAATPCGAGVCVLLLFATYGLDLSPGFF